MYKLKNENMLYNYNIYCIINIIIISNRYMNIDFEIIISKKF
jgi:hypothetical protein